ncbi:MAG: C39 family peptidase [Oscillospiraceae bacterium]|nr:C39 family peptidase [Oscillospiraceae bacterium]
MKKIFLFLSVAVLLILVSGCVPDAGNDMPETEITFSDENGISFSLLVTPCTPGQHNGKIKVRAENDHYMFSIDCGRSFRKIRNGEAVLNKLEPKSYSFCLMDERDPDDLTEIYTVSAANPEKYPVMISAASKAASVTGGGEIAVRLENYDPGTKYEVTADGGQSWQELSSDSVNIDSLKEGTYIVSVREKSEEPSVFSPTLNVPVILSGIDRRFVIETAECILQEPELPTGCEITSLTMLLNHIGFSADKLDMADNYLPKGEYRKADFHKVFVGDPRSRLGYGCTAEVIIAAAEKYLDAHEGGDGWEVKDLTGLEAEELYSYICKGDPVVVWASIDMGEITPDFVSWTDEETGNTVSWYGGEHCLLMTGYDLDEGLVYFNDPLAGKVTYDMDLFEQRYREMQRGAVVILDRA